MEKEVNLRRNEKLKLDQIMKVLFKVSKKVMIGFINEIFDENFIHKEVKIEYSNSEFIKDNLKRIIGDMFINIHDGMKIYRYHIEFQTTNDNSMIIRMFQYGFEKACESIEILEKGSIGRIDFPKQLVIFIEENKNIKDELSVIIGMPDGKDVIYKVPVIKYWNYTLEDLKEKKLYILLPLQVFKSRKSIDRIYNSNIDENEKRQLIRIEFEKLRATIKDVIDYLVTLNEKQVILIMDLEKILRVIGNISEYLYQRYGEYFEFGKEVHIMIKTLYDPAIEMKGKIEGRIEGKIEGKIEDIIELLKDIGKIPKKLNEKINKQKDLSILSKWHKLAAKANSIKEFEEKM